MLIDATDLAPTDIYKLIEPCTFALPNGPKKDACTGCAPRCATRYCNMCNFFHAMLYADYIGCSQKLSKWKTFGIVA
jgi:hypothetical protein